MSCSHITADEVHVSSAEPVIGIYPCLGKSGLHILGPALHLESFGTVAASF